MKTNKTKIAIAGIGTVGNGLLDLLKKNNCHKNQIEISAIASRRKNIFEGKIFSNTKIFKDAADLIKFDNYDILVELIGGEDGVSKKIIFNALRKKKSVVTANKALVSKYFNELRTLTSENGGGIKFEAAVAGGIPIIKVINEFLISNQIRRIYGILNGTSNFILSKMLSSNEQFKRILSEAQKLGFAESDPTFDLDGTDTAHKLTILSSLAFNFNIDTYNIENEGINDINLLDLSIADSLGYKIKLLGITEVNKNKIKNFVYPCLLPKNSFIAKVDGVYNGVVVESDFCKKSCFIGEGAGSYPTATSVYSDIIGLMENKFDGQNTKEKLNNYKIMYLNERFGSYYLRFITEDRPGVISGIANEFKNNNISMKSMLQKDPQKNIKKNATIVITTHNCLERDMMKALKKINALKFIKNKTVYIRIEDL